MNVLEEGRSTALVAVNHEHEPRITPTRAARPDASFVAHLIAMASASPQTRVLRRATLTEALCGYKVVSGIAATPQPANSNRIYRVA